jgi:hypothetical protein
MQACGLVIVQTRAFGQVNMSFDDYIDLFSQNNVANAAPELCFDLLGCPTLWLCCDD